MAILLITYICYKTSSVFQNDICVRKLTPTFHQWKLIWKPTYRNVWMQRAGCLITYGTKDESKKEHIRNRALIMNRALISLYS